MKIDRLYYFFIKAEERIAQFFVICYNEYQNIGEGT